MKGIEKSNTAKIRALVHGVTGVGKTTFAAGMPRPLFICAEDGARYLGVDRYRPRAWDDLLVFISELRDGDHNYQTLVIDSIDHLEPLVWDYVCTQPDDKGRKHPHISAWPYGQGYARALSEWRILLSQLDQLSATMRICLIAHTSVRPFKNPVGEDYDRYEIKLHRGASAVVQEWADVIGFAAFADINPIKQDGRKKAPNGAARQLHLQRRAAWDAKARFDSPAEVGLDWLELAKLIPGEPAFELGSAIRCQLSGAVQGKAEKAFAKASTQQDLANLAERIKQHLAKDTH